MNIVIAGGGDVGVKIAEKLIYEDHNVTIIERDHHITRILQSKLDAMVIQGDITNIETLLQANILEADSFIAVTNEDNDNLLACSMVNSIVKKEISITSKVDNYKQYFNNDHIDPKDFGVDRAIRPLQLTVEKVLELLDNPNIFEIAKYADDMVRLVGVKVTRGFEFSEVPISEISQKDDIFTKVRLTAIQRGGIIIVPKGDDVIYPKDKLYLVGKTDVVNEVVDKYFSREINLKSIIIVGGNKHSIELANVLSSKGRDVSVIEEDLYKCKKLSSKLDKALVINGSATDSYLLEELSMEDACVISMSDDDEYNILSAFNAKKHKASKTMCMIKNSSIVTLINNLEPIDTVFSPHALTIGETLKTTRKTDLFSVSPFTEIDAETIGINITKNIPILNKPLTEIKLPSKSIIGVIVRGDKVIIPTGKDVIKLGDRVIIFMLPEAIYSVEKIFSTQSGGRR